MPAFGYISYYDALDPCDKIRAKLQLDSAKTILAKLMAFYGVRCFWFIEKDGSKMLQTHLRFNNQDHSIHLTDRLKKEDFDSASTLLQLHHKNLWYEREDLQCACNIFEASGGRIPIYIWNNCECQADMSLKNAETDVKRELGINDELKFISAGNLSAFFIYDKDRDKSEFNDMSSSSKGLISKLLQAFMRKSGISYTDNAAENIARGVIEEAKKYGIELKLRTISDCISSLKKERNNDANTKTKKFIGVVEPWEKEPGAIRLAPQQLMVNWKDDEAPSAAFDDSEASAKE